MSASSSRRRMSQRLVEIVGNIKNYEWGKKGNYSTVAQLAAANVDDFKVDDKASYAELWMGVHPSGPSFIKSSGEELGHELGIELPYLFKVLSIEKPLSIQVHPNKAEAERLFQERPDIYKDPNHKPELAIALTSFLALCGFRPYTEIKAIVKHLPPLAALLGGEEHVNQVGWATAAEVQQHYTKLMKADDDAVKACVESIAQSHRPALSMHHLLDIFTKVNKDFPNDVGVLSLFFLNLVQLNPGEAMFLNANEIHAYLSGDCIECMACSDNVIRAGLTPKYKDVDELIACLNYEGGPPARKIFMPRIIDDHLKVFVPPVEDFAVAMLKLEQGSPNYTLQLPEADAIVLVMQGNRVIELEYPREHLTVKKGSIIYVPAECLPKLTFLVGEAENEFVAYIAMKNIFEVGKN